MACSVSSVVVEADGVAQMIRACSMGTGLRLQSSSTPLTRFRPLLLRRYDEVVYSVLGVDSAIAHRGRLQLIPRAVLICLVFRNSFSPTYRSKFVFMCMISVLCSLLEMDHGCPSESAIVDLPVPPIGTRTMALKCHSTFPAHGCVYNGE